jgi:hypothetical protein
MTTTRPWAGITRRGLLAGAAGVGVGLGTASWTASPAQAATYDYTSRADFDRFLADFAASGAIGQPSDNNETGALAWGQAYVLLALVRMYETTNDTVYLDRLVENIDSVLEQRDQARGVADYRGVSGPVWRAMGNYTAATATLKNAAGHPLLQVRSAQGSVADHASVEVQAGTSPESFTLVLRPYNNPAVTLADVNFDTTSSQYFFKRVYLDVYNPTTRWSVRDLRPDHAVFGGLPLLGATTLQQAPFVFAVHTGQLTYPIASFVRIVYQNSALRRNPTYRAKANAYLAAVEDAIAFHSREYVPGKNGAYKWVKESPVPCDGSNQPLNQSNMLGATAAELFRATGSAGHRTRVRELGTMMRASMTVADNAYKWTYWPLYSAVYNGMSATGYLSRDISSYTQTIPASKGTEDISHGALNLEFMTAAYRTRLAGTFTTADMRRLAATYTHNIAVGSTEAHQNVDGSGTATSNLNQIPRWMPAAEWDPAVFTHALAVTRARAFQPVSGSYVAGFAYCVWGAHRFGKRS